MRAAGDSAVEDSSPAEAAEEREQQRTAEGRRTYFNAVLLLLQIND